MKRGVKLEAMEGSKPCESVPTLGGNSYTDCWGADWYMGQSHYKIPKRTGEIPRVIGGSSQLLVESHRPSGLVRENY